MLITGLLLIGSMYVFIVTWLFYLAIMMLKTVKDELTKPARIVATPLLIIGILLDVFINITIATVLFLELPREFLLTSRCKRHIGKDNFRGRFAMAICKHFLNPFDNNHCGDLKKYK